MPMFGSSSKIEAASIYAPKLADEELVHHADVPMGVPVEPNQMRYHDDDDDDSAGSDWTLDPEDDFRESRIGEPGEADKLLSTCFVGRGDWQRSAGEDGRGPMAKPKKCRDVLFFLLFILMWVGWIVVAWVVITDGCPQHCNDPRRLVFGTDSETGEMCGTGNQTGRERVYYANPVDPLGRRFCVKSCPSALDASGEYSLRMGLVDGDTRTIDLSSVGDVAVYNCFLPSNKRATSGGEKGCFYPAYETLDLLYKCVPVLPSNVTQAAAVGLPRSTDSFMVAASFIASPGGFLGNAASELQITWPVIAWLCLLAVSLGFVWLLMLRGCAMFLVMGTIFVLCLCLIALSLLAWDKAGMLSFAEYYNELAEQLDTIQLSPPVAEAIAVIITVATACFILLVCCMFRRIRMAVRLITESAKAVHEMPSTILFPLSTLFFVIVLAVWTVVVGLFIASAGEYDSVLGAYSYASRFAGSPVKANCANDLVARNPMWLEFHGKNSSYDMGRTEAERLCVVYEGNATRAVHGWELSALERLRTQGLVGVAELEGGARDMTAKDWLSGGFRESLPFDVKDYYRYFWIYHAFGFVWTYTFCLSCLFMCLAGAVGHWYWREEGEPLVGVPIWRAFLRLMSYQLGTAAFGSLIVSLVWIARISFQMAAKRLKVLKRMPAAGAVLCMINCCLGCVEMIMKYINRNTVIVAAIHGESYCWSATKAFSLLMSNILRVAAVSVASMSLIVMGKVFITASCVLAAWAYFSNNAVEGHSLHGTPVTTLVVVGICAWLIARLFLNIYMVVIDTVLLCFFEDSTSEKPVAATRQIDGFVKKEDVFERDYAEEKERRRRTSRQKRQNRDERRSKKQGRKDGRRV